MRTLLFALWSAFLISVPLAFAHGGPSFERTVGKYFIDIGYDDEFKQGREVLLDFALYSIKNGKPDSLTQVSSVTFSVLTGSTVLFTKTIPKPDFGKIFATYTPDQHGRFDLTAAFSVDGTEVVKTSFPFVVQDSAFEEGEEVTGSYSSMPVAIAGAVIVAIAGFILWRRKSVHL
jgi:LPXTG-motif cell wall-anchored protein